MDSEDKKISACPNLSSRIIEYSPCALLANVLATWGLVKDGGDKLNRPPFDGRLIGHCFVMLSLAPETTR